MFKMESENIVEALSMLDAANDAYAALDGLVDNILDMLDPLGGDSEVASKAWKRALLCKAAELCAWDDYAVPFDAILPAFARICHRDMFDD